MFMTVLYVLSGYCETSQPCKIISQEILTECFGRKRVVLQNRINLVSEGKTKWCSCISFYCLEIFQSTFNLVKNIT